MNPEFALAALNFVTRRLGGNQSCLVVPNRTYSWIKCRGRSKSEMPQRGRAYLDATTISDDASLPLPARHERGEGWGEGFVSAAPDVLWLPLSLCPLPTPSSWGEG